MKNTQLKILRFCAALLLTLPVTSCNNGKKTKAESQDTPVQKTTDGGQSLIEQSDCVSCHKPKTKLIGPSFQSIAKKYAPTDENYEMLTHKIIKGGKGNWGPIAMSPHPTFRRPMPKGCLRIF